MFVRSDDLATALKFITAGSCVSIIGPEGSGRSMLLRELASSLEQRGYPTIQILGIAALRAHPFDPLDSPPSAGRASTQAALSNREREVARLAAHGQSNHEIAARLQISTRTVESHLLKVFRKLQISGRTELSKFSWA